MQEGRLVMNAEVLSSVLRAPETRRDPRWESPPPTEIALNAKIDADTARVLQALTVPEYLEAWISHPECKRGCVVRASRIACSYRIDFIYSDMLDSSISGSIRMLQSDKLLLTWRRFGVCEEAQSVVNIVLQGDGGSSLLQLRHIGLPSRAEFEWHEKLWGASLRNLSRLFQSRLSIVV
jgi:uncharacterized protein YndB with AHSA1/START domain